MLEYPHTRVRAEVSATAAGDPWPWPTGWRMSDPAMNLEVLPGTSLQEPFTWSPAISVPIDGLDQLIPRLKRVELLVLTFLIRQRYGHGREMVPVCEIEEGLCTPECPGRPPRLTRLRIRSTCAGMARRGILDVHEVPSDTRESLYGLRASVDTPQSASGARRHRAAGRKPASRQVLEELRMLGLSSCVALTVIARASAESIQAQIAALPLRRSSDPGATLVRAVLEQWSLPQDFNPEFLDPACRAESSPDAPPHHRSKAISLVKGYMTLLSGDERKDLERQSRDRIRATGGAFFVPEIIPRSTLDYFVRVIALERMISSLEAAVPGGRAVPQVLPPTPREGPPYSQVALDPP